MVRDGLQKKSGRTRQRYRCVAPGPNPSFHRFVGAVARTRNMVGVCAECENPVAAHEGPVAPWHCGYLVREVAAALVDLGRGSSYTDAAKRVRAAANVGANGDPVQAKAGQTVADWLADFVPAVAARHAETAWPQTIVLDSTEFTWTNPRTRQERQLFTVLAAWGYPVGVAVGRLWKLAASPTDTALDWGRFLASLPGRPELVVCDRDLAIKAGVGLRWGKGKAGVPIHWCEHHLFKRGLLRLKEDGVSYGGPVRELLAAAFTSREGWDAFDAAVTADPALPNTARWVRFWRKDMRVQTGRRASIPAHYANGAIEHPIAVVRQVLERRAWCFRNRARMDLLLQLVALRVRRVDDERVYASDIHQFLLDNAGKPARAYRDIYDTWGPKDNENGSTRYAPTTPRRRGGRRPNQRSRRARRRSNYVARAHNDGDREHALNRRVERTFD